jgi:hypothetical protein
MKGGGEHYARPSPIAIMVYILNYSREQAKKVDRMMKAELKRRNPDPPKFNPVYRDMQNIVEKAKRGERI